jgi:hypothetical protein
LARRAEVNREAAALAPEFARALTGQSDRAEALSRIDGAATDSRSDGAATRSHQAGATDLQVSGPGAAIPASSPTGGTGTVVPAASATATPPVLNALPVDVTPAALRAAAARYAATAAAPVR